MVFFLVLRDVLCNDLARGTLLGGLHVSHQPLILLGAHSFTAGDRLKHVGQGQLCTIARAFTDTQSGRRRLGLWCLEEILEVMVFREDIVQRFVHNIVRGCADESGILIDLCSGGLI
jgi:hypothetical protein